MDTNAITSTHVAPKENRQIEADMRTDTQTDRRTNRLKGGPPFIK